MKLTLAPGTLTLLASCSVGALLAVQLGLIGRWWGGAPIPALLVLAATAAGWPLATGRTARWRLALGGAAWACVVWPALLAPGPLAERAAYVVPGIVGAGGAILLGIWRAPLQRAGAAHLALVLASAVLLQRLPAVVAPVVLLLAGAAAATAGGTLGSLGARRLEFPMPRAALAVFPLAGGGAAWVLMRSAQLPGPAALDLLLGGAALGLVLPGARWGAALGAAGLAAVLAGVAGAELPAAGSLGLCGFVAGAGARAVRPGDLGLLAPLVALGLVLPVVRSLPPALQSAGARAQAALPTEPSLLERVKALQQDGEVATAWGWWGSSQVWGGERVKLVELDGSAAGSSGRARGAERLAGTLAGCSAAGRDRVRVVGDDFGRVSVALREQHFLGIDAAMPDPALAARLAAADDGTRRTWLSSETRLLDLPPAALLGARGRVDAAVEVLRVARADGRTRWPDALDLRLAASRVRDDGAFVLVLPGLDVHPAVLGSLVRRFAEQWPTTALWLAPEGAESLILVGSRRPTPWLRVEDCARAAGPALRGFGIDGALELASLVVADHRFARALAAGVEPGRDLGEGAEGLPLASLLAAASSSTEAFEGAPDGLAARQDTRRAAVAVLAASARGDVPAALRSARALQGEAGAGAAMDPMVAPMLERARRAWRLARDEGAESTWWGEADAAIEAALLLNPGSASARCLRGDIAMSRKRFDEALTAYIECSERDPANWLAWQGVAAARQQTRDLAGAEAAFRESARLAPDVWQAALNLGVFLRSVGQAEEAETWLRRAAGSAASDAGQGRAAPHRALALLYLETGRAELALVEARRAETDEPTADSAWLVGAAAWELGRWDEAEAAFRQALERRPAMPEARTGLGMCQARRQDYAAAARSFRDALAVDPEYRPAREKLALLEPLLGAQDEALRRQAPAPR